MKAEIIDKLYSSFDLKERQGLGGMRFKYIESTDIIDRMNKVFKGCWSTEVMSQEKIDDFVVVRVKVSVYDEDSDTFFMHEGYGSSTIMRYTAGEKKGQIIDLGNAYKSAEAKAIKNACSRWGVGLYLEAVSDNEEDPSGEPIGGGSDTAASPKQPTPETIPPPFPKNNEAAPAPEKVSFPEVEMVIPDIPLVGDVQPEKGVPTVAIPNEAAAESPTNITQEANHDEITDVQKVAIQGLLQIKAATFADVPEKDRFLKLAADALGRAEDLPGKVEDLTYQEAVTIIKYGNKLGKK